MNRRRKQRLITVGVIGGMVAGAISLMLFALNDNIDLFYNPMTQIQKDYYRNIRGLLKSRSNMNKLFKHISLRRPKKLL